MIQIALATLVAPIMLLNIFAGTIGTIWLAWLGEWSIVAAGVALVFFGHLLVGLSMTPSLLVGAFGLAALEQGNRKTALVSIIVAQICTYLVMGYLIISFFNYFASRAHEVQAPYLLFAYAAAMGMWTAATAREQKANPSADVPTNTLSGQIGCALSLGYFFITDESALSSPAFLLIAVPMSLSFLYELANAIRQFNIYPRTPSRRNTAA